MAFKKGHAWAIKSKQEGMNRAKRCHVCLDCRYYQTEIYKSCPECGSKNRQYFMSEAEFHRGMSLMTLQLAGTISNLRFQPRYDLAVNGKKICTYVADADYYQDGVLVCEDSKPEKFIDDLALVKIKLFEAIYGITVKIPQRKSGNRSKATAPTLI
jgi:hypothetical protein